MSKTTLRLFSIPDYLKPDWLKSRSTLAGGTQASVAGAPTTEPAAPRAQAPDELAEPSRLLDPSLKPGQIVAGGRFRIEQLLDDTGSMAFVYKATQLSLSREIVLKVLRMRFGGSERDRERIRSRLQKELRAYGKLKSHNIVTVHDSGWTEDGHPWIAMEFLDGRSLRSDMRRKRIYSQQEMLAVIEPVARALSAAHKSGIVHNDVKPENIFLVNDGTVKLVDFGTAKFFEEVDKSSGHNLGVDTVIGTPAYMPPERHFRQPSSKDDPRSDLYSLGIVEMEMLTGFNPITNNDRKLTRTEIANKHAVAEFQKPVGASIELWAVIEPLLRVDRERRTSTAEEHIQQLNRVAQILKGPPQAQSLVVHTNRAAQSELKLRRSMRSAALGAVSGSLLVACGYLVLILRARHFETRPVLPAATTSSPAVGSARPRDADVREQQPPPSPTSLPLLPAAVFNGQPRARGTHPSPAQAAALIPPTPKAEREPLRAPAPERQQTPPAIKPSRPLEISEDSPYAPGKL